MFYGAISKIINQLSQNTHLNKAKKDGKKLEISDLACRGIVLSSKNKGPDQLCGYHTADLHLCLCIC